MTEQEKKRVSIFTLRARHLLLDRIKEGKLAIDEIILFNDFIYYKKNSTDGVITYHFIPLISDSITDDIKKELQEAWYHYQ